MKAKNLTEEAVAGLSAGIVGTVLGYPLDVIKTRMQTGGTSIANRGIIGAGIHIIRTERLGALYNGIGPPLVSLTILNTGTFTTYSILQETIGAHRGWDIKNGMAGAMIGPAAAIISTVENFIKTQMQIDTASGKRQYTSSWDCTKKLIQQRGITVVYTGNVINTTREGTFLFTYFNMYEGLRYEFMKIEKSTGDTSGTWAVPVAGGLSGATAWFVSFPLDLVRARIQGRDVLDSTTKQQRAIQIFIQLLQQHGVTGLYSGVTPSIIRAFLVSGTRFSAYEGALWLLRGGRDNIIITTTSH